MGGRLAEKCFPFFLSLGSSRAENSLHGVAAISWGSARSRPGRPGPWKARCRRLSEWKFIGDSSPAASVEGARRPPCNARPALQPPGCPEVILAPLCLRTQCRSGSLRADESGLVDRDTQDRSGMALKTDPASSLRQGRRYWERHCLSPPIDLRGS